MNIRYGGADRKDLTYHVFQDAKGYAAATRLLTTTADFVDLSTTGIKPGTTVFVAAQDKAGNWASSATLKLP